MIGGLETTFRVLAKTDNGAAVKVLLCGLESPNQSIQDGALAALLERRHPAGQGNILRQIPALSWRWKRIISQHPGRLTGAMRDAILGSDEPQCLNACQAAVMFHDYDLIPTLLTALEDASRTKADKAAETLSQLAVGLYDELAIPSENKTRRDPQWINQYAVSCLETSLRRFGRHRRREVVEALLLLAKRDNNFLNEILKNPHHVVFLVLVDVMANSSHDGVMRLQLDYLDDPQSPSAVLSVVANRMDLKFVRLFMRKIGREPSLVVCQNLKRMQSIAWLRSSNKIFAQLDDSAQHSIAQLVTAAGIPRTQAFSALSYLLQHGKPGGRREAARALAAFSGADVNTLVLQALADTDPQVQANLVSQLRRRGIPGVMPRLVKMLDSPHLEVRQAVRQSLSEYTFARFLVTFEMLDDEARRSTAALVKEVDPQAIPLLRDELQSNLGSKRFRALQIAGTMDVTDRVEDLIIILLGDKDHIIRSEAAAALAKCRSPDSRLALEEGVRNPNPTVCEAVQRSLDEQARRQSPKT